MATASRHLKRVTGVALDWHIGQAVHIMVGVDFNKNGTPTQVEFKLVKPEYPDQALLDLFALLATIAQAISQDLQSGISWEQVIANLRGVGLESLTDVLEKARGRWRISPLPAKESTPPAGGIHYCGTPLTPQGSQMACEACNEVF